MSVFVIEPKPTLPIGLLSSKTVAGEELRRPGLAAVEVDVVGAKALEAEVVVDGMMVVAGAAWFVAGTPVVLGLVVSDWLVLGLVVLGLVVLGLVVLGLVVLGLVELGRVAIGAAALAAVVLGDA